MTEQDEKAFVGQIKQQLDQHADSLDELTSARLKAARLRALEAAPRAKKLWVPAFGTATAAAVMLAVLLWQNPPDMPGTFEELDIIASGEDLELIEELDFYDWLDATQTTG